MSDQHSQNLRVGKSNYNVTVFQGIDVLTNQWQEPIIVPKIDRLNVPAANAAADGYQ